MIDLNPQFIRTATEELVVLTRAEFDALIAEIMPLDEDAEDVAIFDTRIAELQVGLDERLPTEVGTLILQGDSLLRAIRKWRGMTQAHVAMQTNLAQSYISDLESGRKTGAPETLRLIAVALQIDPKWILLG